jgi:hypothetical protein
MIGESPAKIYVIENNLVNRFSDGQGSGRKGGE